MKSEIQPFTLAPESQDAIANLKNIFSKHHENGLFILIIFHQS